MYHSSYFWQDDDGNFTMIMPENRPLKILQLTDCHFGFGPFSKKCDALAKEAIRVLVERSEPDLIMLTGDNIFPFIPRSGTSDNEKQALKLIEFMDSLRTPYGLVFGNHDVEMGSKVDKDRLSEIFMDGKYSIFNPGPDDIFGTGNYIIKVCDTKRIPRWAIVGIDSNMYGDGWFMTGFDCIHEDQSDWIVDSLTKISEQNPDLKAFCFFHIPLAEYKKAYAKMRVGDKDVTYHFGAIGEKDHYFGISKYKCEFFNKMQKTGIVKGMFCGHDHYNNLSVTYKGVRLTYGMSIDYLGYPGIKKRHTQRGGTVAEIYSDGSFDIYPLPLSSVVSPRVRGIKKEKAKK